MNDGPFRKTRALLLLDIFGNKDNNVLAYRCQLSEEHDSHINYPMLMAASNLKGLQFLPQPALPQLALPLALSPDLLEASGITTASVPVFP
jgi:hypothetical protein